MAELKTKPTDNIGEAFFEASPMRKNAGRLLPS